MNIPNLQARIKIVDSEGYILPNFHLMLTQMLSEFQNNLSDEGYKLPKQSTENIAKLNNIKSEGALIYNTELKKAFINENGTFKEIVTS